MGKYSNLGLYSKYDKNNKERQKEDYYATPVEEVKNIMNTLHLPLQSSDIILEPCCGGGHMVEGILQYSQKYGSKIIATDIKNRQNIFMDNHKKNNIFYDLELDFFQDDYPYNCADYVIMNPPFKLIEPFIIRGLEIAKKGLLCFARLQFLEGVSRYNNILKDNPPTDVYVYVDRIGCYKNGDMTKEPDKIQAYAWFYWNKKNKHEPVIHFLRKSN